MDMSTLKALHIIFVVSWFAGLFYMVRLFIYHVEAQEKLEEEKKILSLQFVIMERKLWWIITTPAMILTLIFGISLLFKNPNYYFSAPWMLLKLGFVVLLLIYHFICQRIMKQFKNEVYKWKSSQLRLWNELATLFLVAIVFLVEMQHSLNWIYATCSFFFIAFLLLFTVKIVKKLKKQN